jgi:hypothetical protein
MRTEVSGIVETGHDGPVGIQQADFGERSVIALELPALREWQVKQRAE